MVASENVPPCAIARYGATVAGAFESLNRRAAPGNGNEIEIGLGGRPDRSYGQVVVMQ